MNLDKLKKKAERLEAEARQALGDGVVDGILGELEDDEFEKYIQELGLKDMQGRVLVLGDQVTSIHGHFQSGEIMGVVNYRDGYGTEFVVLADGNKLHNVGSSALQFISRKGEEI